MGAIGSITLLFPAFFYFLVLLFNGKSLKWYYLLHTGITILIIASLIWNKWGDWFDIENHFNTTGILGTVVMSILLILILTQTHRKPYTEILKKEIWGEWAEYKNK